MLANEKHVDGMRMLCFGGIHIIMYTFNNLNNETMLIDKEKVNKKKVYTSLTIIIHFALQKSFWRNSGGFSI